MKEIEFTKNLIKGRAAETIFAQMLRETKKFTVLEFGYEKIVPELVQSDFVNDQTIETIRRAPDFAVINRGTKEVKLIEVKFQKRLSESFTLIAARKMMEAWNPSYLFIVSEDGFFFDDIKTIVENNGKISPLNHPFISKELQEKYLNLLRELKVC